MISIEPIPEYTAFGYRAAARMRQTGVYEMKNTYDGDARHDRQELIAASRALYRDNWLVSGIVNRAHDYILGPSGFALQVKTGIAGLDDVIENEIWRPFADQCDVREMLSLSEAAGIVLRDSIVAGDSFTLKLKGGTIQLIEAERATKSAVNPDGSRWEQGILLSPEGAPRRLRIDPPVDSVRDGAREAEWNYVLHHQYAHHRASQTRCMPALVSILPLCERLDDILNGEAVRWQIASKVVMSLVTESGRSALSASRGNAETNSSAATRDLAKQFADIGGWGIVYQGKSGDDLKFHSSQGPGSNIAEAVMLFCRLGGIPLGIPAELIFMDSSKLNYSQYRGMLQQAYLAFRLHQVRLVRSFYTPIYRWVIGMAVATGRLKWRPSILNHRWDIPSWPWVDEDKEVQAWAKKIDRALATQTQALASLAKDRGEFLEERDSELRDAWNYSKAFSDFTGGEVMAKEVFQAFGGPENGKTAAAFDRLPSNSKNQNNGNEGTNNE